ncbi:MAG: thioredoxin family protein [Planctomycetaceae bacterium]|nr:thioredoxin family protein [Planctomycetaceae bacterium]
MDDGMNRKLFIPLIIAAFLPTVFCTAAEQVSDELAAIQIILQHPAVTPGVSSAIEIKLDVAKDWHFYADGENALKITAQGNKLYFSKPVFTKSHPYFDKLTNQNINVYSETFSVFIPFTTDANSTTADVNIVIEGVACNNQLCKKANYQLSKTITISADAQMDSPVFDIPSQTMKIAQSQNVVAPMTAKHIILPLAILAGLLLNVMPCVWPILPIIVMRLVTQAQRGKAKSLALGVAFGLGIILFFAVLAAVNIILKLSFGLVFQWADQFRNPVFRTGMSLLIVLLALYMFGLFSFGIPASVSSGKQKGGFIGSVGMGFLAAVLSTPCSFAILTFVLAWAQTQPIPLATITILLIGVGMAAPYVILTMIPKLLNEIPKPGRWMELFKHATGFILLILGVGFLKSLGEDKIINILYYTVVLTVCVWLWGVCVSYDTPQAKKYSIRFIAVLLALIFSFFLLTAPQKRSINWQPYDANMITQSQNYGKPVLIKFTATWCFSCKILDKTVYSSQEVADLIKQKGVLAIMADTTDFGPADTALKNIYNEPAIPVTILLLPKREPVRLRGNLIKNELITTLKSLTDGRKNE